MTVAYEASGMVVNDEPGITPYDDGYPVVGAPRFKATDADLEPNIAPGRHVQWTELDYTIGGETGEVNRNAFVINGIPVTFDAHDFRGDHAVIPVHYPYGSYGAVGDSDDYASEYVQGIAANAYPDVGLEESWSIMAEGI